MFSRPDQTIVFHHSKDLKVCLLTSDFCIVPPGLLNYWTEGHFGHWTLKFTCFVLPGHYGCPRAFKQKSFLVEGILKPEFMKLVYSIKYMSQMCRLEFDVAFTMLFITPLTLSRKDKLTISITLPSRFTKKSTSLTHYSSKMFICMKNGKQKTQLGSVSVLNLIVASIFKKNPT